MAVVGSSALLLLLLASPALGSRCNGEATPGPRNELPIDEAPPAFVKQVPNGKLYTIGQHGDKKDLVHLWGSPYENGYAMGQLLKEKMIKFIPEVYHYTEGQIIANLGNQTWCNMHALRCFGLREVMKLGLTAALDLSYERTAP